jgi:hypothetical protein
MRNLDIDTVLGWRGRTVRDPDGDKIGSFGDVFLDGDTDRPAWGGVRTGLFGNHESYVPLERVDEADDDLVVPFSKELVKDAPRIEPDVALTLEEEAALWRHYGQEYVHLGDDAPVEATGESRLGDDAMTRSEEEVRIGEGPMRPAERVRLRKVMVTDHERRVVPVRKEVIQLDTEPAPEGQIESVEDVDHGTPGERELP